MKQIWKHNSQISNEDVACENDINQNTSLFEELRNDTGARMIVPLGYYVIQFLSNSNRTFRALVLKTQHDKEKITLY